MARGWESKSVEAQQEDAGNPADKGRPKLSPAQAARSREQGKLRLSRQNVLQQLARATNPRHRQLLQNTLADLDQKLQKIQAE